MAVERTLRRRLKGETPFIFYYTKSCPYPVCGSKLPYWICMELTGKGAENIIAVADWIR